MNDHVNLSADLPEVTTEIFTTASVAVGLRGSGKTECGVVLAEEAVAHGVPVVAIDPTGVWYGMRSSRDGKGPGLPFYVFGGEHADVPLEPDRRPGSIARRASRRVRIARSGRKATTARRSGIVAARGRPNRNGRSTTP